MKEEKLTPEEIHKFLQACEDLICLGTQFTGNVRTALEGLKQAYDPVLKSNYVDKAVVELLTRSLTEYERKVNANLKAIDKICTKGGKWFAFYLGKSLGSTTRLTQHEGSPHSVDQRKSSLPSQEDTDLGQARSAGV